MNRLLKIALIALAVLVCLLVLYWALFGFSGGSGPLRS